MYKKTITYTNFNGDVVTKDFYFNITEAEITLRQLETDGNWTQTLERIKDSNKGSVVFPEFKKIIKWTYGEKSADGEQFIKSEEAWARFENSEPWSALIMELITSENYAQEFITAVLPQNLAARAKELQARNGFRPGADISRPTPPVAGTPAPVPQQPQFQAPVEEPYQPPVTQQPYIPPTQPATPPQFTQAPEQGIERTSAPRDWTPGQGE